MEYNTQRSSLEMREYGRNIKNMIAYCCEIEDDQERNDFAKGLIELMGHLNPQLRNIEDFRHKLWHHLIIMSDFKLKVDSPYDTPTREELAQRPDHIGYPKQKIRFKHYGKNVESMVKNCIEMADEPEKQKEYAETIGSYMKLVSMNYNKENINDETIHSDLGKLSEEQLKLEEDVNLDVLIKNLRNVKPNTNDRRSGGQNRKGGKGQQKNRGGRGNHGKKRY